MIFICCLTCRCALRVSGLQQEVDYLVGQGSEFWPDKYACYNCGGAAQGMLTPQVGAEVLASLTVTDVAPAEAFAALNGLGLPPERLCCSEVIAPLFEKCGITVRGRDIRGTTRTILDEITFPDGTRIYLAGSAQGAVVYRVVPPHSYTSNAGGVDG